MEIRIIRDTITKQELKELSGQMYGDLVKAVVDIEQAILAINGEMHADEEQVLLTAGSKQQYLWGINLYPDNQGDDFIEFDSMINLRPSQGNRSRSVEDAGLREKIRAVVAKRVQ